MVNKRPHSDFFWSLAILSGLCLALTFVALLALVDQFDAQSRRREEVLVSNGLVGRKEEVTRMVTPQVVWDDAVRHLDNRFDAAWAQENIGQFLHQADGFDASFVLDAADQPRFGMEEARLVAPGRYASFAGPGGRLVSRLRAAEAGRAVDKDGQRTASTIAHPIQADTFVRLNGKVFVLTATLVGTDFGTARIQHARAPIVVAAMEIDGPFLSAFAKRFLLQGVDLGPGGRGTAGTVAHAPLRADDGEGVATLMWTAQRPGHALLQTILAPLVAVVLIFALAAMVFYRRGVRTAQGLIASEARASHLAYFDSLTGLPNRVRFLDRLTHALELCRRNERAVAVHCIDLDRFKEVNDTFGHLVGDQLLQQASRRMAQQCRAADTMARLSGDEFAIVQADATAASAAKLAERLIACMSAPFDLDAGRVYVACSVGISVVSDGGNDSAEALRQADLALYRAKADGGAQSRFFEIEMDAAIKMRRAIEHDLRLALANGDLEMVYQPQVNRKGAMTGVEALARWSHADRGMVPPSLFIPIAEECGLIVDVGFFTLRRAFEDSRAWPHLKTAINVSVAQMRMKDFVPRLKALVKEMGVDPTRFELEITEGLLLGDDPATHETLRKIRQMGFALALDDFGTGYSSLSYLQQFPVTKIKIDRSFITNLGIDGESEAVVAAIVKLARALNLEVIAEGVETSIQRERLAAAGCAEVQGYYFSRPVPAAAIAELMTAKSLEQVEQTSVAA